MTTRTNTLRRDDLTNEFNNDYTGPADMGHGGNVDLPNTPRIVGGVGRDGSEDQPMPPSDSGLGHGGNVDLPGAPTRISGVGRAGEPKEQAQGELLLEANGI